MDVHALAWAPDRTGIAPLERDVREELACSERAALGCALQARSGDILEMCQLRYVAQAADMTLEVARRHPMWDITSVAVTAIAEWLVSGVSASDPARARIASLGNAAAIDQETAITQLSSDRRVAGPSLDDDTEGPTGVLSVALVTKLNLWWRQATCHVLTEEAGRAGISDDTLAAATDMVDRSCSSSLVRMAKQYDLELQDLHARLLHLASHDQLTGLANRAVFLARLETAISRIARHPGGLAVVFIDIDNFKSVNDVLGHGGGDELLTVIAERFTDQMRPEDTIARFGGDEFVALFEDLGDPATEATALAERLHQVVAEPIMIAGDPLYVTASIGVAVVTDLVAKSEDVLAQADMTMYGVKRSGRNRVAVVEMGSETHAEAFAMVSELRGALDREELALAYQPIFSIEEESLVGFEALCRWDHARRGVIPPLSFIPVAEVAGQMPDIGEWVLDAACRQSVTWSELWGTGLSMAVNVSGRQLADARFPASVARVLNASGLRPELLTLEITEGILLEEGAEYETALRELRELGVRLAVDDFGIGYSSLDSLGRFPVDQVKLDRAVVRGVADRGDTRILGAVVRLSHELGLAVIAEGIECDAERSLVRQIGCDAMQGYLLGYPLSPALVADTFA